MKIILILLSSLIPISVLATTPDLPEGAYSYLETKVYSTKHIRVINIVSKAGKKLYNDYRELGYTCARKTSKFVKCQKMVANNPNQIDFETEEAMALSPDFGEVLEIDPIIESGSVDQYKITQTVSFNNSSTDQYKLYYNHSNDGTYLDIQTKKIKTTRFRYADGGLTQTSFQTERLNKHEVLQHVLLNMYTK